MNHSLHASVRAQQRCIPQLILIWLDEYGEEAYDGNGGCTRYFSKASIRAMERDLGKTIVRKLIKEYQRAYKVEDSHSGVTITTGYRRKHIHRK